MKTEDIQIAPILVDGMIRGIRVNGQDLTIEQIQVFKDKCARGLAITDALLNARSTAVVIKEVW